MDPIVLGIASGLGVVLALSVCVFVGYAWTAAWVGQHVPDPTQGPNAISVHASPFRIRVGDVIAASEMIQDLDLSGYRPNGNGPRTFRRMGDAFAIGPQADQLPEVLVTLSGNRVVELKQGGITLNEFQFEPPLVASFLKPRQGDARPLRYLTRFVSIAELKGSQFADALLSAEDRRFSEHNGLEYLQIAKAVFDTAADGKRLRGASTLSQQVARNIVFHDLRRSWARKFREMFATLYLERHMSKDEILSLYVNGVYTGSCPVEKVQWIGFGQAAAEMFGRRDLRDLTLAEAATLAGVVHQPSTYIRDIAQGNYARLQRRRNTVLDLMRESYPTRYSLDQVQEAKRSPVRIRVHTEHAESDAAFFADHVIQSSLQKFPQSSHRQGPINIVSTIDLRLQRFANDAVQNGLNRIDSLVPRSHRGMAEAALLAVEPRTGEILALVGGRSHAHSAFNRAIDARRQPGSVFKPFDYLALFEKAAQKGWTHISPATIVVDEPTVFWVDGKPWVPKNYGNTYGGATTLRRALAQSRNVAAVKVAQMAGLDTVADLWHRATGRVVPRSYPSMALGSVEVTATQVAEAYSLFANGGSIRPLRAVRRIVVDGRDQTPTISQAKRVARTDTTFLVTSMLRSVLDEGTAVAARVAGFNLDAAGKTGTTNDLRDAWFVGFTPELLTVVWVGRDDNTPLGLTGGQAALPIWTAFMTKALAGKEPVSFKMPEGITAVVIDPQTGKRANALCPRRVEEVFLAGSEPLDVCPVHR